MLATFEVRWCWDGGAAAFFDELGRGAKSAMCIDGSDETTFVFGFRCLAGNLPLLFSVATTI